MIIRQQIDESACRDTAWHCTVLIMKTFDDLLEEIANMVGGIHESKKDECTIRFRLEIASSHTTWRCRAVELAEAAPNRELVNAVTLLHSKLSDSIRKKIKLVISQFRPEHRDSILATIPEISTLADVGEADVGLCADGLVRIAAMRGERDDSDSKDPDDWLVSGCGDAMASAMRNLNGGRTHTFSLTRVLSDDVPPINRWGLHCRGNGAGGGTVKEAISNLNDKMDEASVEYVKQLIAGLPRRA